MESKAFQKSQHFAIRRTLATIIKILKMKTLLNLILVLSLSNSFSQNLTLDELISLRKKQIASVEEYLNAKNWNFLSAAQPYETTLGDVVFVYKKNEYDDSAQAFIKYFYNDDFSTVRVNMQVARKEIYNLYLARIKSLGCKLIKSSIEDNEIIKIYKGATTTILVTIATQKDEFESTKTFYNFFIVENLDYMLNISEEVFVVEDENKEANSDSNNTRIGEVREMNDFEVAEVNYHLKSKAKAIITRKYFIGKWIDENSILTFLASGDFILKYNTGQEIKCKWKFENNQLYIDIGGNDGLIKYNISENDLNYFNYNLEENAKNYNAYRIID